MKIYWLDSPTDGCLGTMRHPDGDEYLDEAIQALKQAGVDVLVSLQTLEERQAIGLAQEDATCQKYGITFLTFPIEDHHVPTSMLAARQFVQQLAVLLDAGNSIIIHCFAGIGRSSMMAAALLATYGVAPDSAFVMITKRRNFPVPETSAQADWVVQFAREL